MRWYSDPPRIVLTILLLVSATLFAIATIALEPSHTETHTTTPGQTIQENDEHAGETAGAHSNSSESAPTDAEASSGSEGGSEDVFGVNPESPGLIAAVIAVSLLLAIALWVWPRKSLLLVLVAFGLVFAAFDVREVLH